MALVILAPVTDFIDGDNLYRSSHLVMSYLGSLGLLLLVGGWR